MQLLHGRQAPEQQGQAGIHAGPSVGTEQILATTVSHLELRLGCNSQIAKFYCVLGLNALSCAHFEQGRGEYTIDADSKDSTFQNRFKWLRQGIHLEVEVAEKSSGITVVPGW